MAGDVTQPASGASAETLWLHPAHHASSRGLVPLRLDKDSGDNPLSRGDLLQKLLSGVAAAHKADPSSRSSQAPACPVTLEGRHLQIKGDNTEVLVCIPLLLADVVAAPAHDLKSPQGDVALHVVAVAPRPAEVDELDASLMDEAWIFCSTARDILRQLSLNGALRWDWRDTFSTSHVLGTGSCGKVFAARPKVDLALPGRFHEPGGCAVKILTGEVDQIALRNEILSLASAAGHPNICGFAGVFCERFESQADDEGVDSPAERAKRDECEDGVPLCWRIALELLPGGDLFDSVSDHGCLREGEAMEMMLGIFSALGHLHSLGLVHRDVKAENVLFGTNRRPVLADFGISCDLRDLAAMQCRVGSPGYVAPEVVLSQQYDEKVDVFGAGAVMYFAIDGQMVFRGSTLTQVLRRTVRCKISYASEAFGALSGGILHLLQSLLTKQPLNRPTARCAFSTAWVLASSQVRAGGVAKDAMAALSAQTAPARTSFSASVKGSPRAHASSLHAETSQTRVARNLNANSESFMPGTPVMAGPSATLNSFQQSESFTAQEDLHSLRAPPARRSVLAAPGAQVPEQAAVTMDAPRADFISRKTQSMGAQSGEAAASKSIWRAVIGLPARLFAPSAKVKPAEPEFHGIGPDKAGAAHPTPQSGNKRWRFRLFR